MGIMFSVFTQEESRTQSSIACYVELHCSGETSQAAATHLNRCAAPETKVMKLEW